MKELLNDLVFSLTEIPVVSVKYTVSYSRPSKHLTIKTLTGLLGKDELNRVPQVKLSVFIY